MKYTGICNSWIKNILLKGAKFRLTKKSVDNLAYDCQRHLDLLERYKNNDNISDALYVRLHKFHWDKSPDAMLGRVENFLNLYKKIKNNQDDKAPVVVTSNGARLDGSHRVSILKSLGVKEAEVKEVFGPKVLLWLVGREVNKRRRAFERFKGKKVYVNGEFKGRISYTDFVRRDLLCITGDYYHVLDNGEIIDTRRCYLEE